MLTDSLKVATSLSLSQKELIFHVQQSLMRNFLKCLPSDDTEIGSIAEDSLTSDEWPEGGLETDGEALPQDDEPGTVNAPSKDGDALSKLGEELDGKEDVVDGTRGTGASRLQDEFADGDAPSVGTASTADDALMGKQTEGRNASSEKSGQREKKRKMLIVEICVHLL